MCVHIVVNTSYRDNPFFCFVESQKCWKSNVILISFFINIFTNLNSLHVQTQQTALLCVPPSRRRRCLVSLILLMFWGTHDDCAAFVVAMPTKNNTHQDSGSSTSELRLKRMKSNKLQFYYRIKNIKMRQCQCTAIVSITVVSVSCRGCWRVWLIVQNDDWQLMSGQACGRGFVTWQEVEVWNLRIASRRSWSSNMEELNLYPWKPVG